MSDVLLEIVGVTKHFRVGGRKLGTRSHVLRAVDGVDLHVAVRETVGLVGESGSGKSTLANLVAGLERPTSGSISYLGADLAGLSQRRARPIRRDVQMVFQDPYSSLAPMSTVGASITEPLVAHHDGDHGSRRRRVLELLDLVGLNQGMAERYPAELSGGQLQRVSIARALALSPKLVLLDEAVSALDVSTKAQVINLLDDLQEQLSLSYLFISHDLSTLRSLSDRIAVMYLGRIVEVGASDDVYERPCHPYTQALLSAVPVPDPVVQRSRERIILSGDVPSPLDLPKGCRFNTRCPSVMDICREVDPAPTRVGETIVCCHLYGPGQPGRVDASKLEVRAGPIG